MNIKIYKFCDEIKKLLPIRNMLLFFESLLIAFLPCVTIDFSAYAYNQTIHPVLLVAKRFGSDVEYMMTINGLIIIYPLLVGLCFLLLKFINKKITINIKLNRCALYLSIGMATGRIIGMSYSYLCSWDMIKLGLFWCTVLWCGYACISFECVKVFYWIIELINSRNENLVSVKRTRFLFLKLWIIFLISWLPRLILMYPFHIEVDTAISYWDAMIGFEDTGYVIVIDLMRCFINLGKVIGSLENGLYIYLCISYLVATITWSYVFFVLYKMLKSQIVFYVGLIIVLVFPYFQMWSIYISKDVQFGVAETFLVFCLAVISLGHTHKNKLACYVFVPFLCLAVFSFRKNGIIDIIVTGAVFVVFWGVNKKKKLFKTMMLCFCLMVFVIVAVSKFFNPDDKIYKVFVGPWSYYISRLEYSLSADALGRNMVALQKDNWPDEILDILGDSYEEYLTSEYTAIAPTNYITIIRGLSGKQMLDLFHYLLKNEPALVLQASIASRFCYFDVGEWVYDSTMVQTLDGPIFGAYLETVFLYDKLKEYEDRFSFLNDGYRKILSLPIISIFSNIGVYIWILIACFAYFVYKKKYQVFVFGMPLICCLVGGLLSGYNAVPRLCIPLILSTPIFIMLCMTLGGNDYAEGSV